jgi:hypothetical protein
MTHHSWGDLALVTVLMCKITPHLSFYLGLFIEHKKKNKDTSEAKMTHLVRRPRSQLYFILLSFFYFFYFMATMDMVGILAGWRHEMRMHMVYEILTR